MRSLKSISSQHEALRVWIQKERDQEEEGKQDGFDVVHLIQVSKVIKSFHHVHPGKEMSRYELRIDICKFPQTCKINYSAYYFFCNDCRLAFDVPYSGEINGWIANLRSYSDDKVEEVDGFCQT